MNSDPKTSIFFITMVLLTIVFASGLLAYAVVPPKGLSGPHKILTCESCHDIGAGHKASKDLTVCSKCHSEIWETLKNSGHIVLMTEATIDRSNTTLVVRYCSTCHSPHNPDYLRIENVEGNITWIEFERYTELCYNCHLTGAAAPVIGHITLPPTTTTTTTTITTQITTTIATTITTTEAAETPAILLPVIITAVIAIILAATLTILRRRKAT